MWQHSRNFGCFLFLSLLALPPSETFGDYQEAASLEIHYINVGQGGSTLIIGPNGTRILYDFGRWSGARDILPYLESIELKPEHGLHYAILSHYDLNHYVGYRALVDAGYDILVANYGPSPEPPDKDSLERSWLEPATRTTAGPVRSIPVGLRMALGNGAEAIIMAANGRVFGRKKSIDISNENDRSIAIFIRYGRFQYILDGDLGGGQESCSEHDTSQRDLQTKVAKSLLDLGLMSPEHGVDVLHIANHGSESSTSAAYYNIMKPEVGLISVGFKQGSFLHPRQDVVDRILLGEERAGCVTAPPLKALYQTEQGKEGCSSTGCTSFTGIAVGDIKLTTDGTTGYLITGTGRVDPETTAEPLPETHFDFDEGVPGG